MDLPGPNLFEIQRRMAGTQEGVGRKKVAFESLDVQSGQTILDVGCGGGQLVYDLALSVGDTGQAVGVDTNAQQLDAAYKQCASLSNASFSKASCAALPFEDNFFDRIVSIQTLEYIDDVDQALAEIHRVLKPNGRLVTISVLWDHWRFHGPEEGLNHRIHQAWQSHCAHQMLPLDLPRRLTNLQFIGPQCVPLGFFNNSFHYNSYPRLASEMVVCYARNHGIPEIDLTKWKNQLQAAADKQHFGFVSMPVLTSALKA